VPIPQPVSDLFFGEVKWLHYKWFASFRGLTVQHTGGEPVLWI
jgi:hypothetical protein